MLQNITKQQADALTAKIYDMLMAMPDMGMGEAAQAEEDAQELVADWLRETNIVVTVPMETAGTPNNPEPPILDPLP